MDAASTEPQASRSGTRADVEVLIVGAGFAGLGMAIALQQAGFQDFTVVEKEARVGGTWLVNAYPGCACDVQSHLYSFSFEPNPDWSRTFASQPEILAYLERCAGKHALGPRLQFSTQLVAARYDERRCWWRVELADADAVAAFMRERGLPPGAPLPATTAAELTRRVVTARVLVSAMGALSTPSYPELPGLSSFRGAAFHTQRWDSHYDFSGKRVAAIGAGASAIQYVPEIQPLVQKLHLFQRTPNWILPKPDRAIGALERWAMRAVPGARLARRLGLYSLLEARAYAFVKQPRLMRGFERLAQRYLEREVPEPELRSLLTPSYSMGCKRILLSNNWYAAIRQPNVEVIAQGVREVREGSVVLPDGSEREVDCIVFATGFRVADPIPLGLYYGRDGLDLAELWKDGPQAYQGTSVAGFPNLFFLVGPNTTLGHSSMVYMIESQVAYVMSLLRAMRREGYVEVEVRAGAQARYNRELERLSAATVWETGGCTSWYLHPKSGKNVALWPDFTFRFRQQTRCYRDEAYTFRRAAVPVPI